MTRIATPEQNKNYWLDTCPICGSKCIKACRCPRNERWCENDHHWRRLDDGSFVLCGSQHSDKPLSLSDDLKRIVRDAAVIAQQSGIDPYEVILEGLNKVPEQMQFMLDQIVAMQKEWPMPKESWIAFVQSVQRTNERLGLNLEIKPELME